MLDLVPLQGWRYVMVLGKGGLTSPHGPFAFAAHCPMDRPLAWWFLPAGEV